MGIGQASSSEAHEVEVLYGTTLAAGKRGVQRHKALPASASAESHFIPLSIEQQKSRRERTREAIKRVSKSQSKELRTLPIWRST